MMAMAEFPDRRKIFLQIARFLLVGAVATFTDLLAYLFLVDVGATPIFAKATSYIIGTVLGFLGNKFWTFGSMRRSVAEPIVYGFLYACTLAVNVLVNSTALYVLSGNLSPAWERSIAFLVATGTTTTLNFLGLRLLTFRGGIENQCHDTSEVKKDELMEEIVVG